MQDEQDNALFGLKFDEMLDLISFYLIAPLLVCLWHFSWRKSNQRTAAAQQKKCQLFHSGLQQSEFNSKTGSFCIVFDLTHYQTLEH